MKERNLMEGIDRIKKLSQETNDQNVKRVAEYLVNREDLNERFLNQEKSLTSMWDFIKKEAQKKAENGCAAIPDEEVYSLAVHYWDESNKDLGIKNKKSKTEETRAEHIEDKSEPTEPPKHKDEDIVMKYKGRDVTYKEFMDKSYLKS